MHPRHGSKSLYLPLCSTHILPCFYKGKVHVWDNGSGSQAWKNFRKHSKSPLHSLPLLSVLFPPLPFPFLPCLPCSLIPGFFSYYPDTFQLPLLHKITCKTTRPVILLLSASSAIFPDCLSVCSSKYDAKCPVRLPEWHFISMESREAFTFSFSRHAILCKTQGDFHHRKCKSTER